jgi:glucose-1-phosphate thymidylyltransferase
LGCRMIGIVLAGGYGTRLSSLTGDVPKALLPLGDTTPLDLILEKMGETHSIDQTLITVNAHYKDWFKKWAVKSKYESMQIVVEPHADNGNKYGAVRALSLVTDDVQDDCLVVTCDNIFSSTLTPFLAFFKAKESPVIAVHDIGKLERASEFSTVKLDKKRRIIDFIEKPKQPTSTLIGTGIYAFPAQTLSMIQEYVHRGLCTDQPGRFMEWLYRIEAAYGYRLQGYWCDIGTPETYLEALRYVLDGQPLPLLTVKHMRVKVHSPNSSERTISIIKRRP